MVEFRKILCPTDLSEPALRSLTYAAAVARWYGAQLTLLHVVPTFDPLQVRSGSLGDAVRIVQPVSREEIDRQLRDALQAIGADDGGVSVESEAGDAARVIVDRAVTIPADLVVMGTHGRGGFERLMIGSVAERVLQKAPCPVLLVPPHAAAASPGEVAFKRILCPMDFSPSASLALGFALDLARQAGGTVTLLHVVEWLTDEEPRMYAQFNVSQYRQQLVDDARRRMQALVNDDPRASTITHRVVLGRSYREILQCAAGQEADLIVMGAQGRGGLELALFGSTTHQVVRAATCPVLTVRGART